MPEETSPSDTPLDTPEFKLLCLADLHIGRTPSKLISAKRVDDLTEDEMDSVSPAHAFQRACDFALSSSVDAVLLSGDLVDKSNALFEAFNVLSKELKRLIDAGIPVIAIAGNHDFEALPRLAEELEGFTLLGSKGTWEEKIITNRSGKERLRVQGISFTSPEFLSNPLLSYPEVSDALPTIALLHCDLDQSESKYAPVSRRDLTRRYPLAWILGHIHKPQTVLEQPLILYPGSPQGLDPGEPGAHGASLLSVYQHKGTELESIELAALRYDSLEVDISEAQELPDVRAMLIPALRSWHASEASQSSFLRFVSLRLTLQGQTALSRESLNALQSELETETLEVEQTRYFFEQVRIQTKPKIDLAALAERDDPPSLLARRIEVLSTKTPQDEYNELLTHAHARVERVRLEKSFQSLEISELDEESLRQDLLSAAWSLLDVLLHQGDALEKPAEQAPQKEFYETS